ncbi:MAG: exodeoxyribonuclease VII small subunit [Euryarchaeota archaeon]|nr:exodeoxyribonuclease VII small subunit [Euryarchaeota archaeon]
MKKSEVTFEEAIKRLEAIVDELEAGELTLEQSLSKYEEGVSMAKACRLRLDEAETRLKELLDNGDVVDAEGVER